MLEKNANETVQSAQTFTPFDDRLWSRALELDVYERCVERKIHRETSATRDRIIITNEDNEELSYLQRDKLSGQQWLVINISTDVSDERIRHAAESLEAVLDETHPFWTVKNATRNLDILVLDDDSRVCLDLGDIEQVVGQSYVYQTEDSSVIVAEYDPENEQWGVLGKFLCMMPDRRKRLRMH
jgi:hypothetical protein